VWVSLTYLGVLFQAHLGLGAQETGWALTALGVGQLAGALSATDRRVGRASRRLLAACRIGVGLMWGLPFLVPIGASGVATLMACSGVLMGVLTPITPLILNQQPRSDTGTVQSCNWLANTAGIALGASLGGALLALGDLPFVGLGTLVLSCLSATILAWRPSAGPTPATQSHPA
jgi:predicted MFS family arabinose efflux permease